MISEFAILSAAVASLGLVADNTPPAEKQPTSPAGAEARLTPLEMFHLAEQAERHSNLSLAEDIYRALGSNPSADIRNEARFRRALLLEKHNHFVGSASLLREILDEQPGAQRVRVELAAVLAKMGDERGAAHELRVAQAGGLPPDVARMIDRFSAALRAHKLFGGSIQVNIAADSNINRATRSDSVGTVIGDFILNDNAKAKSGKGLALDGEAYARLPIERDTSLLLVGAASADLYRDKQFNDVTAIMKAGPEASILGGRANISATASQRWFGGSRYTTSFGGAFDLNRPIFKAAHIRISGTADRLRNHVNSLESGWVFTGSSMVEVPLSPRAGAGIALSGVRRSFRDPGYSNVAGQVTIFGYRDLGHLTLTASASAGRLIADRRLQLYPDRRAEWLWRGIFGVTFRQLGVAGFAPTARLTLERNRSSIELYDYRRTDIEFGVVRAF